MEINDRRVATRAVVEAACESLVIGVIFDAIWRRVLALRLRQHARPVEMSDHAAMGGDADQQRIARRELHLAAGQPVDAIGAAQAGEPLAFPLQAQMERIAAQQAPAHGAKLPLDMASSPTLL